MVCLHDGEKKFDMFVHFDTIPACDGQTDGQISCNNIDNTAL